MDKRMIALEVMFVFQGRGIEPGSFSKNLIHTIALADSTNKAKLATVYPEYVELVKMYFNTDDSYKKLLSIAGISE